MRKYHLPIASLKTDSFKQVLDKLEELEKVQPKDAETRLFIRHKDAQEKASETPFLGTFTDLRKYLQSATGDTSVNMFAAKMRGLINS